MLKESYIIQPKAEFVIIEDLVPEDHLLRKLDEVIDFSFIREKVRHLYSESKGRSALDPVILFKMLFIGYLFGIRSERRLVKEIEVNVAYRWFLGYGLMDKIPNHSTISQNRRRRFIGSNIYQEIFDEIVYLAIEKNLVDGNTLFTDSTHIKASASKNKYTKKEVSAFTADYLEELEKEVNKEREKKQSPHYSKLVEKKRRK